MVCFPRAWVLVLILYLLGGGMTGVEGEGEGEGEEVEVEVGVEGAVVLGLPLFESSAGLWKGHFFPIL